MLIGVSSSPALAERLARLTPDQRPIPGVYLVRLTQGPHTTTFKTAVVR